jgi:hypothetical protein
VLIMYLWATMFSALVVWFATVRTPLFVFAVITFAAVVALLVMSMPRLRWWQRGRSPRPAVAGGPAAAGGPMGPDAARTPVAVGAPPSARPAPRRPVPEAGLTVPAAPGPDLPGPDLTVPDLLAEPAPTWRVRSVIGTPPPAASYPGRRPLGVPGRPEAANPDAGDDGAASATRPIGVPEAERRPGGLP